MLRCGMLCDAVVRYDTLCFDTLKPFVFLFSLIAEPLISN